MESKKYVIKKQLLYQSFWWLYLENSYIDNGMYLLLNGNNLLGLKTVQHLVNTKIMIQPQSKAGYLNLPEQHNIGLIHRSPHVMIHNMIMWFSSCDNPKHEYSLESGICAS